MPSILEATRPARTGRFTRLRNAEHSTAIALREHHFHAMMIFRQLASRWFLIALACCLLLGLTWPTPFVPFVGSHVVKNGLVAVVMFLMALPLDVVTIRRAIDYPLAVVLGLVVSLIFIPLIAIPVAWTLPPSTGWGLLVLAAIPTSIASSVIWTRRAGGNDAVALLITLITNGGCFLFAPLILLLTIGQGVALSWSAMLTDLLLYVLCPILMGQLVRFARPAGRWATENRVLLSNLAQFGILAMILLGTVQMRTHTAHPKRTGDADVNIAPTHSQLADQSLGAEPVEAFAAGTGTEMVIVLPIVLTIHLAAMAFAIFAGRLLKLPAAERVAVAVCGSQKTMLVGLKISMDLDVSIMPVIVYHVSQLIVDLFIVDYWRSLLPPETIATQVPDPPAAEFDAETGLSEHDLIQLRSTT